MHQILSSSSFTGIAGNAPIPVESLHGQRYMSPKSRRGFQPLSMIDAPLCVSEISLLCMYFSTSSDAFHSLDLIAYSCAKRLPSYECCSAHLYTLFPSSFYSFGVTFSVAPSKFRMRILLVTFFVRLVLASHRPSLKVSTSR